MVMSTFADLILKAVSFLTGERSRLRSVKRDQIDRISDYLQNISDGLKSAAEKFAVDARPWGETREMAYHLDRLLDVLADTFKDDAFAIELRQELRRAVLSDYLLLGGPKNRTVVDAITLRPPQTPIYDWKENPVSGYSSEQLEQVLADEVRKLEEASGLFRAVAQELRARAI
jgi:hypothetical protein